MKIFNKALLTILLLLCFAGPEDRFRRKQSNRGRRSHLLLLQEEDDSHLADDEEDFVQAAPSSMRSIVRSIDDNSSRDARPGKLFTKDARNRENTQPRVSLCKDNPEVKQKEIEDQIIKRRPDSNKVIKQEIFDKQSSANTLVKPKEHNGNLSNKCNDDRTKNFSITEHLNVSKIKVEIIHPEEALNSDQSEKLSRNSKLSEDDHISKRSDVPAAHLTGSINTSQVNNKKQKKETEQNKGRNNFSGNFNATLPTSKSGSKQRKQSNCNKKQSGKQSVQPENDLQDLVKTAHKPNNASNPRKSRRKISQIYSCEEPKDSSHNLRTRGHASQFLSETDDVGNNRPGDEPMTTSRRRKFSELDNDQEKEVSEHSEVKKKPCCTASSDHDMRADSSKRGSGGSSSQPQRKRSKNSSCYDDPLSDDESPCIARTRRPSGMESKNDEPLSDHESRCIARTRRSSGMESKNESVHSNTNFRDRLSSDKKKSYKDNKHPSNGYGEDKDCKNVNNRRSKRDRSRFDSSGGSSDDTSPAKMAPPPSKKLRSSGSNRSHRKSSQDQCAATGSNSRPEEGNRQPFLGSDAVARCPLRRSVRSAGCETTALVRWGDLRYVVQDIAGTIT